jgi:hypothetical protein
LREQASDVYLLALAQLTQHSVEADSRPDEVALVGPLALDEGEAVAYGALVADEEEAASAVGVGVEFVTLVMSAILSHGVRRTQLDCTHDRVGGF